MRSKSGNGNKSTIDLNSLWEERMFGEDIPQIDWNRPVSHQEVEYLLRLYPYLQMINSEAVWEEEIIPRFKRAPSGWVIHDYGQAMSTSPGKYLFGPGNPELKEEEGGGSETGAGTIITQTYITAEAMIEFAMEKGWPGVEIVSGTPFMQWAAWMAALNKNYTLVGYEPTEKEKKKRERILRLAGGVAPSLGVGIRPSKT
ncbi:MAG TPA: hypothetical protein VHE99_12530 [Gammaproteobacteria bacterium]|nr:hypothetical protein [Gammaproteobacteria bacterium]